MICALILIVCSLAPQEEMYIDRELGGFTLGELYQDKGIGKIDKVDHKGTFSYQITFPTTEEGIRITLGALKDFTIYEISKSMPIDRTSSLDSHVNAFQTGFDTYYVFRETRKNRVEQHGWVDGKTKLGVKRYEGWSDSKDLDTLVITCTNLDFEETRYPQTPDKAAFEDARDKRPRRLWRVYRDLPLSIAYGDDRGEYISLSSTNVKDVFLNATETTDDKKYRRFTMNESDRRITTIWSNMKYSDGYLFQYRMERFNVPRSQAIEEINKKYFDYAHWLIYKIRNDDGYINIYFDGKTRFVEGFIGTNSYGIYLYEITDVGNYSFGDDPVFFKSAIAQYKISDGGHK